MQMKFCKLSRILTACLLVFVVLGFVCTSIPLRYNASNGLMVDHMSRLAKGHPDVDDCGRFDLATYVHAHIQTWRSSIITDKVIERMSVHLPKWKMSVEELASELTKVRFDVLPENKLRIGICSSCPEVCAGVVNAYADVVSEYVNNENRIRNEKTLKAIRGYIDTTQNSIEKMKMSLAHVVDSKSEEVEELKFKLSQAQVLVEGLRQDAVACTNGVRSVEASSAWRAEVPKWPVALWRIRQDSGPDQLCDENH